MSGDLGELQAIIDILPFLLPLIAIEIGLMVFALVNIVTRKKVRGGNKAVWIVLVVLIGVIGPIIYFVFGREEEIIDSDQD